jgi:16S rRNA processing protein RimM
VGRPHGLDGSFRVTGPVPELLAEGRSLLVDGRRRRVEQRSGTDRAMVVRLEGSARREDAEALRGAPLEAGEFWAHELVGCAVVDGGREVGVVARMVALPSCEALEVGDRLIPLVRDAIRSIDVAGRRIDVDLRFLGE